MNNKTIPLARCAARLADAVKSMALMMLLLAGAEREASAYTDPGSGALIWQMVAAGFVGAMFYLRKFTSWFKRKKPTAKDE